MKLPTKKLISIMNWCDVISRVAQGYADEVDPKRKGEGGLVPELTALYTSAGNLSDLIRYGYLPERTTKVFEKPKRS